MINERLGEDMALYVVGDYIRETRIRKGYTQEEVSFGICTPASLSRIENGAQTPGRYKLDKLLERLGTENNVFTTFVSKEEMEIYETIQTMTRNIADGDMEKLEVQIERLENLTKEDSELEKQYLIFAKAELLRKKGGSYDDVLDMLLRAIHVTLPSFDGIKPLYNNLLTFDEIVIIDSIAVLYAENGDINNSLKLNFWLKEYMEEKLMDCRLKTAKYPIIVYNLSQGLGEMERYHEALEMTNLGIDFCVKYGSLFLLPKFIFNKACCLAELEEKELAGKCFDQSAVIFEVMNQNEKSKMATDWCKKHYKIDF